jgi:hypothetical protein
MVSAELPWRGAMMPFGGESVVIRCRFTVLGVSISRRRNGRVTSNVTQPFRESKAVWF